MDAMPKAAKVWLTRDQQDDLERFARSRTLAAHLVQRAKIILLAATRQPDVEIAQALGITRQTVALWRGRFLDQGLAGIEKDAPRSGRPRTILPDKIDEIVTKTTRQSPPDATHWSTRSLAEATGVSPSTVGRIWRSHGLKPHRVKTFKLSNDPRFAEKLETWWTSTFTRPQVPWSCRSMKSPKSKRWTAPSPVCPGRRGAVEP
jgi:transposase